MVFTVIFVSHTTRNPVCDKDISDKCTSLLLVLHLHKDVGLNY